MPQVTTRNAGVRRVNQEDDPPPRRPRYKALVVFRTFLTKATSSRRLHWSRDDIVRSIVTAHPIAPSRIDMKPIPKRTRASLPNTLAGIEDISVLNLAEVRSRLERNERVLSTSLFSTSPTSSTLAAFGTSPNSPLARGSMTSPPPDPFREKLLAARQALLTREQELLMEAGMVKMEVAEPIAESSSNARRRSEGTLQNGATNGSALSGKARAMEAIQAGEVSLSPSGKIL